MDFMGEGSSRSTYCSALMEGAQRMEHTQGEQKGGTRVRAHGDGPGGRANNRAQGRKHRGGAQGR